MAQRVIPLTCTIPAGTPISAPAHFPFVFAAANVERIDVRVPPGPSGTVGFNINHGGGGFIPEGAGNWIIADNQYLQWPLDDAPNNGNWDIVGYNLDVLDHTIYVFFNVSALTSVSIPVSSVPIGL